jgi:hypothetical protein
MYQNTGSLSYQSYSNSRYIKYGKDKGLQYSIPLEFINQRPVYNNWTISNYNNWIINYQRPKTR